MSKDSAGRGMLAGLIREIESLEAVLECEDGITKMGKRTIQNTINWMKDRANSYAKMNAKLNGGATPYPERCPEGITPFDEGVPEVLERCTEGVPEVYTKGKDSKGKERIGKDRPEKPPLTPPDGNPYASFENQLSGRGYLIIQDWIGVWTDVFGKAPFVGNLEKKKASTFEGPDDLKPAMRAYLTSGLEPKFGGMSLLKFLDDPSKWINLATEETDTGPTQEELAEQWRLATERDRREAMGQ